MQAMRRAARERGGESFWAEIGARSTAATALAGALALACGSGAKESERACEVAADPVPAERFEDPATAAVAPVLCDADLEEGEIPASEATPQPTVNQAIGLGGGAGGAYGGRFGGRRSLRARGGAAPWLDGEAQAEPGEGFDTEAYDPLAENPFKLARDDALSTFSIDVDTASYSNVRRFLREGRLPPPGAVRIEELVNYFRYQDPAPNGSAPFSVTTEVASCPWAADHELVRVGLRAREVPAGERKASNLVFLIDVSGSMEAADKLPLLVRSMRLLVDQLDARDTVAIVVYAGASGLVLQPTSGANKTAIAGALASLAAGGSTNGGEGIELAYRVAREHFVEGGTNRVILCTDGDFNVGVTSQDELVRLIERSRESGVFLSVLGFGTGNVKDSTMEKLADKGNGQFAYIDSLMEARKVLVEELGSTLEVVAKDVKIQVEFNREVVQAWRLIGYENRVLAHQDFNDDAKDAGEIGAGHCVTALYEIVPAGVPFEVTGVDPLRYQAASSPTSAAFSGELMFVKLRHKAPDGAESDLTAVPVLGAAREFACASENLRFAAAVACFGMKLRQSAHCGSIDWAQIRRIAGEALGADEGGYRAEFVELIDRAAAL